MCGAKPLETRRIHSKCCFEPVRSCVTGYVSCSNKVFCSLQVTDLKRIFQFCVQALGELSKLAPPHSDEVLALLKHLLSIAEGVLSWGFISVYHILYGLLYLCYLLLHCWLIWWGCCVRRAFTVPGPTEISLSSVSVITPLGYYFYRMRFIPKYVIFAGTLSYHCNLL
jgi:hypothetical protein